MSDGGRFGSQVTSSPFESKDLSPAGTWCAAHMASLLPVNPSMMESSRTLLSLPSCPLLLALGSLCEGVGVPSDLSQSLFELL